LTGEVIDNTAAAALIFAVLVLAAFILFIIRKQEKRLFNYLYVAFSISLIIWLLSIFAMKFFDPYNEIAMYICDAASNIGVVTAPVLILISSIVYTKNLVRLPKKYLLLFVIPAFSLLAIWTNPIHHQFYTYFSVFANMVQFGPLMIINGLYQYICVILSIYLMLRFAVRNSSYYLKQIVLFCLGNLLPIIVSMLASTKLISLPIYLTPLSFMCVILFHGLAIFRFNFLNLAPIATQNILDRISDCYAIINHRMIVIDYNKQLPETFGSIFNVKRNIKLQDMVMNKAEKPIPKYVRFFRSIEKVRNTNEAMSFETMLVIEGHKRYFYIELIPIIIQKEFLGIIILIRDITRSKLDLKRIRQNQNILIERERLASLGQLIGGIAHNLKTPIMSISGSIFALENLVNEYRDSIEDSSVSPEDHMEIADEMMNWLHKMKPYCTYMSDIISTVKDQAVQMNTSSEMEFSVDDLIKRVEILMKHELNLNHCQMIILNSLKSNVYIKGDINSLVQVFNNFIINAIHSYHSKGGNIVLSIDLREMHLLFGIKDFGSGIPQEVQPRLFKEMITTKGTQGTGLGLYMSYVAIKGKFGGDVWFDTAQNVGTTFYIKIPVKR
jgi:two-component system sensor histidine kinase HupT/HoxJ